MIFDDFPIQSRPAMQTNFVDLQNQSQVASALPKEVKGISIDYNPLYFSYLPKTDLTLFKRCCIKQRCALFDDQRLKITQSSEMSSIQGKQYLKMSLVFSNGAGSNLENFELNYKGSNSISLWAKPQNLPRVLQRVHDEKQDLVIDFTEMPFHIVIAEVSYTINGAPVNVKIPVPNVITKFAEPQIITISEFKKNWSLLSHTIFKSVELPINTQVLGSYHELYNYFPNFNEIKKLDQSFGNGNIYRIGGLISISNTSSRILLRISWRTTNRLLFQAIQQDNNLDELQESTIEYLLQTLAMIFTV